MAWPKTVPILEAKDICRGALNGARGRHCLSGWRFTTFDSDAAFDVVREIRRVAGINHRTSLPRFNDNPKNSEKTIARIWNRAMARLGYVVGNPEAKRTSSPSLAATRV